MTTAELDEASTAATIGRSTTLLLATIAALAAASLYYIQPLLGTISDEFGVGPGEAGLLVTATQLGFVGGLAIGGPMGDRRSRRSLLATMLTISAAMLGFASIAPTFWLLAVAMVAIGLAAAAAQIAVPFAASLAAPQQRGQVTGTVMSGLLLGILLARTVSGALSGVAGWRWVFVTAAAAMVLCALAARICLPADGDDKDGRSTIALIGSVVTLVRVEPTLRNRMILGMLAMFSFSAMWTSAAFMLFDTYRYTDAVIGLFGLVGAAGAVGAPVVGRLADRGHGASATTIGWLLVALGWGLLWLGASSLVALICGLLVFDFAVQALQISNQSRIYQLDPRSRGRITTAYMVATFTGGMIGSAVSGAVYSHAAWSGVCIAGLIATALGAMRWLLHRDR